MGYSLDIKAVRDEFEHAATHLSEALDAIDPPYHDGETAPETVRSDLLPLLNAIDSYATTARQALLVMTTGGLAENENGDWYVGDHGPFLTLGGAREFRAEDRDDFILQIHEED